MTDQILSYREMCDAEDVQTLQRGMNFRLCPTHFMISVSRCPDSTEKMFKKGRCCGDHLLFR